MGTDVSGSYLRGLLVPDPRITSASFNSTDSTITQAGPLPGDPEPQSETDMVLESSGSQSANARLRVRCIKAGNGEMNGGRFVWENQGDTLWRGHEPPHNLSAFEYLDFTTTASKWLYPNAITLSNGKVLAVVQKSSQTVACWVRAAGTGTWTETEVYDKGSAYAVGAFPCVVQRPDGRVLCFFVTEDTSASASQVRMFYSDDDGATWTVGGADILSSSIDSATYTITRMRVAMLPNGHMSLVIGVNNSALTYDSIAFQYASTNGGARFDLIDSTGWTGATDDRSLGFHDLVVVNGQIMLAYLREDGGTTYLPFVRFIGSVNQLFSAAQEYAAYQSGTTSYYCSKSGGAYVNGDLAVVLDDDGMLYMVGRDENSGTRECYVTRSTNGGLSWRNVSYGDTADGHGAFWDSEDGNIYPNGWAATVQGGRIVLIHTYSTDAETHDPSLCVSTLGGYTTVTLPFRYEATLLGDVIAWQRTWLPFAKPETFGAVWTETTAGAPTSSFTSTGMNLTTAVGEAINYTASLTTGIDQGLITLTQVQVTSGTAYVTMRTANATPVSYNVRVEVSTTAIVLKDLTAGTTIATVTTAVGATGVAILFASGNANGALGNSGKARAWYRAVTSGNDEDREWIAIGSSTTVQAGASSGDAVIFGILGNSNATFRQHSICFGAYTGKQLYGGQSNPSELCGRQFSSSPTWVDDGVKIRATSGPAFNGDTWHIDTQYTYAIQNVFHDVAPSPNRGWRSTDETQHDIVIDVHDDETQPLGGTLAIYLGNINFKTFDIALDGGGSFASVLSGDTSSGQTGLSFDRYGDQIGPSTASTGTSSSYWYTYNALAGSHIKLNNGGTHTFHRITHNSEGGWQRDLGVAGVTKLARVFIADATGAPTGGLLQTTDILSKDVVIFITKPNTYSQIRIRIDAQDTCEGYFTIGSLLIGHVAYFGRQYSFGRSVAVDPLFDMQEGRSGRRKVKQLGPARRSAEFAWLEGVDTSGMNGTTPAPDFISSYTAGPPVASTADTPFLTLGLVEQLGPVTPVVYLPAIPHAADSTAFQILDRNRFLYGRIVSAGRIENVLGNEFGSPGEVFTAGTIRVEEEL